MVGQQFYSKVMNTEKLIKGHFDLAKYPKRLPKLQSEKLAAHPTTQETAMTMNQDEAYLQSIVDGTIDLSNGEAVEAELFRIGENLTPELEALFEKAVDVYAAYQVQQAIKFLSGRLP